MNNTPLRLAFIGGSINSAVGNTHKISCQMDGRWELVAGCFSTNSDINQKTAERWGVEPDRTYGSWQELLNNEKEKIDAVSILTPTPDHWTVVSQALSAGFPVICEKALATSYKEVCLIEKNLFDSSGFLAVTYNYSGYPMLRELKTKIENDELGKILQIHIEMPQEGFIRLLKGDKKPVPQTWRLQDSVVPTIYLDLGVHLHHTVSFLTEKKPIEVVSINNSFGFFDVVDNTLAIAKYTDDLVCNMWFGKTSLGQQNGLKIKVFGEKKAAEWLQTEPEYLVLHDNHGRTVRIDRSFSELHLAGDIRYNRFKPGHPDGFLEAFANYYYDIADSLIQFKQSREWENKWVAGIQTAKEGMELLEAISTSATTNKWCHID